MFTSSVIFCHFFMGSSKVYGLKVIEDDKFLSMIGTIGIFMGVFRFIWGIMLEKLNFKATYAFILILNIMIAIGLPLIMEIKAPGMKPFQRVAYSISGLTVPLTMGCHYLIYPVILAKIYGTSGGIKAYTIGYVFHGIGSLTSTLMVKSLDHKIGFKGLSWIFGALSTFSLVVLLTLYKGSKTK